MTRNGAKAIYVDIGIFDLDRNDLSNDRRLIESTAASKNVIYPMVFHEVDEGGRKRVVPLEPLPDLAAAAAGIAHAHLEPGPDGVVRSVHLAYLFENRTYWGPSVELLRRYFGLSETAIQTPRPGVVSIGDIDVPVGEPPSEAGPTEPGAPRMEHELWIDFFGDSGTFDRVSAVDVLEGRSPAGRFDGKIVLYGMTATGLGVAHTTPMSATAPMPGVELQANVVETILRRRFLRPVGRSPVVVLTTLAAMGIAWLYGRWGTLPAFWLLLGSLAGASVVYFVLFCGLGYWMEATPVQTGAVLSFIGSSVAHRRR
jgi:CHASE2 domain-containing sensor protein